MTEPHRFLVSEPLAKPGEYLLGPEESRHAARVLRLRVGDAVTLFDGRGRFGAAAIAAVDGDGVAARIDEIREDSRPSVSLTVATAVPKGKRWRILIEKCTELGADRIVAVRFDRSVAKAEGDQGKWRRWAVEAAKQSRRARLPEMQGPLDLAGAVALAGRDGAVLLVASPDGDSPRSYADALAASGKALVLIGPEGGMTDGELERCRREGAAAVRLSPFVLRVETAAAAACTLIQNAV
ncbi:MAG: 16S rRNA (uracil(1498)-N(3))-methyltransferase [Planctomycetota bacterium]|nr:16S rRNA (uracil(1498)-N(3))-methyltransferase [Planctomycetota bacterium]